MPSQLWRNGPYGVNRHIIYAPGGATIVAGLGGSSRQGSVRHRWANHLEDRVDDGVLVIAAARDRLHGGGIEQTVADEAIVDVHADHLSEHHVAVDVVPGEVGQRNDLHDPALQGTGR